MKNVRFLPQSRLWPGSAGALEYTMEVPGILPEGGGSACRATLTPL